MSFSCTNRRVCPGKSLHGFTAADMGMLVPADHMGKAAFFECVKRHRCSVMVPGKGVACSMGQPLPALETECLGAEIERSPVDEKHRAIHPLHRHIRKNVKKRRTAQLFVRINHLVTSDRDTVEECMIVIADYRYQPELLCKIMDERKSWLWTIAPVQEIPEVDKGINRAEAEGK